MLAPFLHAWTIPPDLPSEPRRRQTGRVYFDDSIDPLDLPAPPGPDEIARAFPVPLLTLVPQDAIDETAVSTTSHTMDGATTLTEATFSYTFWRNPADRSDPANLADLPDAVRADLDAPPVRPLPEWMLRARERMRYPLLWDAVRTTHVVDPAEVRWLTPAFALVEHVNYILMNAFRDERVRAAPDEFPGELLGAATERSIEHGIPVSVDGVDRPGMRVDTDAHVYGLGVDLGDRILTAVFARERLPSLELAFRSWPTAGTGSRRARAS